MTSWKSIDNLRRLELYVTNITRLEDGSETDPSLNYLNDRATGMYYIPLHGIAFTCDGNRVFSLHTAYAELLRPLRTLPGTATNPSYTFSDRTDLGIYSEIDDELSFTTSGTKRMRLNTATMESNLPINITDATDISLVDTTQGSFVTNGGARIGKKLYADDITFATAINNVTAAEFSQLENINNTTISPSQWNWLGQLDQNLTTSNLVEFRGLHLTPRPVVNYYIEFIGLASFRIQPRLRQLEFKMLTDDTQFNFTDTSNNIRVQFDMENNRYIINKSVFSEGTTSLPLLELDDGTTNDVTDQLYLKFNATTDNDRSWYFQRNNDGANDNGLRLWTPLSGKTFDIGGVSTKDAFSFFVSNTLESNYFHVKSTKPATDANTAALVVDGGIGVSGKAFFADTVNVDGVGVDIFTVTALGSIEYVNVNTLFGLTTINTRTHLFDNRADLFRCASTASDPPTFNVNTFDDIVTVNGDLQVNGAFIPANDVTISGNLTTTGNLVTHSCSVFAVTPLALFQVLYQSSSVFAVEPASRTVVADVSANNRVFIHETGAGPGIQIDNTVHSEQWSLRSKSSNGDFGIIADSTGVQGLNINPGGNCDIFAFRQTNINIAPKQGSTSNNFFNNATRFNGLLVKHGQLATLVLEPIVWTSSQVPNSAPIRLPNIFAPFPVATGQQNTYIRKRIISGGADQYGQGKWLITLGNDLYILRDVDEGLPQFSGSEGIEMEGFFISYIVAI